MELCIEKRILVVSNTFRVWGRRMILKTASDELLFEQVELYFIDFNIENIFALKNNKTLQETIEHRRYEKFNHEVYSKYSTYLNQELGKFLFMLKKQNDSFYLKFLNKYGDRAFCTFSISDDKYINNKGLYAYVVENDLKYIGRCRDTFKKRLNQGYGKIHPKNCYIDGQATNCHLNSLINQYQKSVKFYVYEMAHDEEIEELEKQLIREYNPDWNISLSNKNKIGIV